MGLTYIYRILPPKAKEYAFFSSAHRTFSRSDHMLGCKDISTNIFEVLGHGSHGSMPA
jgi:hypothetical protein